MDAEQQPLRSSPDESAGGSLSLPTAQQARPATVLISYARKDAQEMSLLQQHLRLRGVHAWRDVTDLDLGRYTREEIARAIEIEVDAFLLYVTPQSLESRFIWMEEAPAALRRWERDHRFSIIPVFRGVSLSEFQLFCADRGLSRLFEFAGVFVPERTAEESETAVDSAFQQVAQRTLRAALKQRFLRVQAESHDAPWLCLHTFRVPAAGTLDLDLDWTTLFAGREPTREEWQRLLLPALQDVKDVLSEQTPSKILHIVVQARLTAALALGATFPATSRFTLWIEEQQGTWKSEPLKAEMPTLLPRKQYKRGEGADAVVEVAISRLTMPAVSKTLQEGGLSYRYRIQLGVGNHVVKDGAEAAAMAAQVGLELRRLRDRYAVPRTHLFLVAPAALAVLVGNQINAVGPVTVYHYQESDNVYLPDYTLNSGRGV